MLILTLLLVSAVITTLLIALFVRFTLGIKIARYVYLIEDYKQAFGLTILCAIPIAGVIFMILGSWFNAH